MFISAKGLSRVPSGSQIQKLGLQQQKSRCSSPGWDGGSGPGLLGPISPEADGEMASGAIGDLRALRHPLNQKNKNKQQNKTSQDCISICEDF